MSLKLLNSKIHNYFSVLVRIFLFLTIHNSCVHFGLSNCYRYGFLTRSLCKKDYAKSI